MGLNIMPFGSFLSSNTSTLRSVYPLERSPSPSNRSLFEESDSSLEDCFESKKAVPDPLPVFTAKETAYIQKQLAKVKYGLAWNWLKKNSGCSIRAEADGVTLYNHHASANRQSDCRGLSILLSKKLARHFNGQYKFYVAVNDRGKAWDTHFFVLAWPTAYDRQLKDSVGWSNKIPHGAMIIDPSFGWMEQKSDRMKKGDFKEYSLAMPAEFLKEGSELNPNQSIPLRYDEYGYTSWLPLGHLKALDAHFKRNNDQAFISIGFKQQPNSNIPKLVLRIDESSHTRSETPTIYKNWQTVTHRGSALEKVLGKMETELHSAMDKAITESPSKRCLERFFSPLRKRKSQEDSVEQKTASKKKSLA